MKQKSFTLIELLVVIAIIGLLSSIVVVNIRGNTIEKARIARNLEFASSLYHAIGDELVGYWKFDGSAEDISGYNNDGTVYGSPDYPEGVVNEAMQFNGSTQYVDCGNKTSLSVTDSTYEFWMKPGITLDGAAGVRYIMQKMNSWRIIYYGPSACMIFYPDYGTNKYYVHIEDFQQDKWYHIAFTFVDGSPGTAYIYVNGVKSTMRPDAPGAMQTSSGNVIVNPESHNYIGYLDEVRIYSKILTAYEIQQHYAEGLDKHKNFVAK